jgi:hypothetical protein
MKLHSQCHDDRVVVHTRLSAPYAPLTVNA